MDGQANKSIVLWLQNQFQVYVFAVMAISKKFTLDLLSESDQTGIFNEQTS